MNVDGGMPLQRVRVRDLPTRLSHRTPPRRAPGPFVTCRTAALRAAAPG